MESWYFADSADYPYGLVRIQAPGGVTPGSAAFWSQPVEVWIAGSDSWGPSSAVVYGTGDWEPIPESSVDEIKQKIVAHNAASLG